MTTDISAATLPAIADCPDFARLRMQFPALAESAEDNPFVALDWFELLAEETLSAEETVHLYALGDAPCAPACVPMRRRGRELASLTNYYSGLYAPIGALSVAQLVALSRCWRSTAPRPAVVHLAPLDPFSGWYADLGRALRAAGYWVGDRFSFGNWYLPSEQLNFANYWAARPAALRNTVRRAQKKLDRSAAWRIAIETRPGPSLDRALAAYDAIYAKSWKPAESYPTFIRRMCRWAAQRGSLRLGVLYRANASAAGGDNPSPEQALASQIWLFDHRVAYIFKLAYDPDAARFSPGSVLTAAMFAHALDVDRAREIDYLSGDDDYKRDWMSHRRERRAIVAFDPTTPHGLAAGLRHFAGRLWQHLRR